MDGLQGPSPTVAADREALSHALWNLLDNAVKYSLECRTVWVDVERAESRLAIRVRDRGLGVPRREHVDVFKRFVRGAGTSLCRERLPALSGSAPQGSGPHDAQHGRRAPDRPSFRPHFPPQPLSRDGRIAVEQPVCAAGNRRVEWSQAGSNR